MLEARIGRSRTTPAEQEESQGSDGIAVSPIGIPLIAGPGAITATMLLSSQTPQIYSYATLGSCYYNCIINRLHYIKKWYHANRFVRHFSYENNTKANGFNSFGNCRTICNKWCLIYYKTIDQIIILAVTSFVRLHPDQLEYIKELLH